MVPMLQRPGNKKIPNRFGYHIERKREISHAEKRRFLPTVEMTRYLEYFGRVRVGGGEAATNPNP